MALIGLLLFEFFFLNEGITKKKNFKFLIEQIMFIFRKFID